jgi:uncharacterized membrane protein
MVALVFLLVITAVFAAVLALEGGDERLARRPAGLVSWITSGNWPAKIGGGLMIVGVGALLRYAAINFDVPDQYKLGVGMLAAALLGVAAFLTAAHPNRRAISLALGGAAFGIAYLTAYSAFALFGYLPTMQGLGLLALTAIGAGVFAVTRSAQSLAVLSMVGAFIAPAFAVDDPGPQVVYRYYVAISLLVLAMVAMRGWRPLIHLSFLFTLAGSAFFAWTASYFARDNADVMLPLIAMLVAVHVAMPLFERQWRGRVVESLDAVYTLALPVAAALTALAIAPSRAALSVELWWFAAIWLAAGAWLFAQKREGVATHAIVGLLLLGIGIAARYRSLPWELVALAVSVGSLSLAARRTQSARLQGFLSGLVLILSAVHILGALAPSHGDTLFLNGRFFERLVGAALMIIAARILVRLHHRLDSLMLTVSIGWAAFAVGAEVARLDLVSAWLLLHWIFAAAAIAIFFFGPRIPNLRNLVGPLVFALGISAVLAQARSSGDVAWITAIVAGVAMLAIALRPVTEDEGAEPSRLLGAVGAPIVVALWMAAYGRGAGEPWQFPVAVGAAAAVVVLFVGMRAGERSRRWINESADIFAVGLAFVLALSTLFDIERAGSAITLEVLCVAALAALAYWHGRRVRIGEWLLPAAVIGAALLLQANLLRWLGPPGDLDAFDIFRMGWRALVTLLWASIGAALTINARRAGSRAQWSAGATFLVGAAIKFVLVDFGSLGQLANILAVIAAGGMFLLVGWLAPMPPARDPGPSGDQDGAPPSPPPAERTPAGAPPAPPDAAPQASRTARTLEMPDSYWQARPAGTWATPEQESTGRLGWTIAIAAIVLITASQVLPRWSGRHHDEKRPAGQVSIEEIATQVLPEDADDEEPAADPSRGAPDAP